MLVRAMAVGDLEAVRPLLEQLGYDIELDEIKQRFDVVSESDAHILLVAESDGRVIGFLHIFARPALEKPLEAVVQSLVVDGSSRLGGVGKLLMATAERWASERGFRSVALASQIDRDDAYAFYTRLGYRQTATSHFLRKNIDT